MEKQKPWYGRPPHLFFSKHGPTNRVGKIFTDYLRNGFGATTAAAWSARARQGLGVSVPLYSDELEKVVSGAQWAISNIHDRLDVVKAVGVSAAAVRKHVTAQP